jgi:hypothetical protein
VYSTLSRYLSLRLSSSFTLTLSSAFPSNFSCGSCGLLSTLSLRCFKLILAYNRSLPLLCPLSKYVYFGRLLDLRLVVNICQELDLVALKDTLREY